MTNICLFLFSFISFSIAACPSGTFNGTSDQFCYKTIIDRATWLYAEYQCTLLGGHLASIDNGFLNHILHNVANSSFGQFLTNDFWIGSSAMYLDGKYLWSDGSNSTYTNWDQDEPFYTAGIYCAFQNFDNAKWHTGECFRDTMPYFCEIPQDSCLKNKKDN